MARKVHQSALEEFVIGYLKKLPATSNINAERKFLLKAIGLIEIFFGYPCCIDAASSFNLITPKENQLTRTIRQLLQTDTYNKAKVIRRFFLLSLKRVINLLNDYIYDCCTETVTVTFDGTVPPADTVFQVYDLITNELLYQTLTTGTDIQTVILPSKYFGPVAFVTLCLNNINTPDISNKITDSTGILVTASGTGITCGTIIKPLQTAYTVTNI